MKKVLSIFVIITFVLLLSACGNLEKNTDTTIKIKSGITNESIILTKKMELINETRYSAKFSSPFSIEEFETATNGKLYWREESGINYEKALIFEKNGTYFTLGLCSGDYQNAQSYTYEFIAERYNSLVWNGKIGHSSKTLSFSVPMPPAYAITIKSYPYEVAEKKQYITHMSFDKWRNYLDFYESISSSYPLTIDEETQKITFCNIKDTDNQETANVTLYLYGDYFIIDVTLL